MSYFIRPYHCLFALLFSLVGIGGYAQENTENVKIIYNKENIPISVETSMPKIKNNIQKVYKGIYKDGKPYEGYFFVEDKESEDVYSYYQYYEKGELKKQYSYDFLGKMMQAEMRGESFSENLEILDEETIFENGKPKHGSVIFPLYRREKSTTFVGTVIYKDFLPQTVYIDIFAMHYGNRIILEHKNDIVRISEFLSKEVWELKKKNNWLFMELLSGKNKGGILIDSDRSQGIPNAHQFYYVEDNVLKNDVFVLGLDRYDSVVGRGFFHYFPIRTKQSIGELFNGFVGIVEKEEDLSNMKKLLEKEFVQNGNGMIAYLIYDENGQPKYGCDMIAEENGGYAIQCYRDGKKVPIVKVKSLEEINAEKITKIMNDGQ